MFSKSNKMHEPGGRMQSVVYEKFTTPYLSQIARP